MENLIKTELAKRKLEQEKAELILLQKKEAELSILQGDVQRLKAQGGPAPGRSTDIHELPFSERIKYLDRIPSSKHIVKSKRTLCKTPSCLSSAIKKRSELHGSEGAFLKLASFKYLLTGHTRENVKFKKELSLDAIILRKNKVKDAPKTFYYHCGLKDKEGFTYVGKTFNTNIDASPGDILKVAFVDISGYTDPKTKRRWANWWAPRPIMLRKDKKVPDTIDTAWRMVEQTTGRFEDKKMPLFETLERKLHRFVAQHHWRGKSAHTDLRFEMDQHLLGFTMADAVEGAVDKPVLTLKDAKDLEGKDIWKVDWQTGEVLKRNGEIEKIWCERKAKQPKAWLDIEGIVPKGEVGATKEFPGIFNIIDKGTVDHGAIKANFVEMFLYGSKLKGRFIFRLVPRKTSEDGKKLWYWLYWKPDDQLPYVLSNRAIRLLWLPEGYSALPHKLEAMLEPEMYYWKASGMKAQEMRKKAARYLKDRITLSRAGFLLSHRHWKGQFVVRDLPVEDWHLSLDKYLFHLDKSPIDNDVVNALSFSKKGEYFSPGEKRPNTPINPNKEIHAYVDKVDDGSFTITDELPLSLSVIFKGKKLKGRWDINRSSESSDQWIASKVK